MTAYLLQPKVRTVDFKQLTHAELNKLLKKLKNKKLGFNMAAVDVTEIEYPESVVRANRLEKARIQAGSYYMW